MREDIQSTIVELHEREFRELSSFISNNYGIKLPDSKRPMLKARLQGRLRAHKFSSFREYCDLVFSSKNDTEIMHMIDMVSTNKTEFFRESAHFTYLEQEILPALISPERKEPVQIWSAACSSGEEVYTLAMVMAEYNEKHCACEYSILGTDISSRMLERARIAVYPAARAENLGYEMKRRYILRSIQPEKDEIRIVPGLRAKTQFRRLNLMDGSYPIQEKFDIIFCRNVLIYFNKETQENVINKLCAHLKPGGYFFLGHSESVNGFNVPLKTLKPTIYKKI